jgi:hypothetical protein
VRYKKDRSLSDAINRQFWWGLSHVEFAIEVNYYEFSSMKYSSSAILEAQELLPISVIFGLPIKVNGTFSIQ